MKQLRPFLAKIKEDYPKIKEIHENKELVNLINYLTSLLNIKISNDFEKRELDIQSVIIIDFLRTKFSNMTIEEVREAFKMYVAKEFHEIKTFRLLDSIVVGEVLNAYLNYTRERLKIYNQRKQLIVDVVEEPGKEELAKINHDFLHMVFCEFNKKGFYENSSHFYEKLKQKINLSKKQKLEIYNKQKQIFLAKQKEKNILEKCRNAKNILNDFKNQIKNKDSDFIIKEMCETYAVNEFLKNYVKDFETFKEILK